MLFLSLLSSAAIALALPSQSQHVHCGTTATSTISPSPTGDLTSTNIPRWLPSTEKVKGVNLGSQFIIEPWMAYDEFTSMGCGDLEDEWSCVKRLGHEDADKAFAKHWDTWITKDDIAKISSYGLNVIRIPVGFWMFEELVKDGEHYPRGGLPYLDRLSGWAADAGLHVIIDLHGGPGNQAVNQSFTGHKTPDPRFYIQQNYDRAVSFLVMMTRRIHNRKEYRTTGVIQVMNEPVSKKDFPTETASMLERFYTEAYGLIKSNEQSLAIPSEQQLKIQFMSKRWGSGDPVRYLPKNDSSILFDDHLYYSFPPNPPQTKEDALNAVCNSTQAGSDTIVGEWSLSVVDGVADPVWEKEWYKTYFFTQVQKYEQAGGWIFWTWKCNWINGQDEWRWCYESAVANGIIPDDLKGGPGSTPFIVIPYTCPGSNTEAKQK